MTVAAGGLGPSPALLGLQGRAFAAPSAIALSVEDSDALIVRIIAAREFEDLSAEDRLFLTKCLAEVDAGASPLLINEPARGDWTAEDAALDSQRVEATQSESLEDGWVG